MTIEKANLNISYMLASLRILDDAGGALSRGDFIAKMAEFMGTSPIAKNGTENRVPYNKTKFDRYFGFIDVKQNGDLLLTPRGRKLLPYIVRKTTENSPDKIYELDHECRNFVQELFLDSCCFDSFGSYNCGAETSNSDIEPPRLILRSLEILDQMTKWELGYVLWGLDRGLFDSYSVALDAVVENRHDPAFNYPEVLGEWDKANFVKDFKMVDLLADENISLVQETDDGNFCLIDDLPQEHKRRISYLNPISQPLQMSLGSSYTQAETISWIRSAVTGRIADASLIFECDIGAGALHCKQVFADAINRAYEKRKAGAVDVTGVNISHLNSTVTLIITGLKNGVDDIDSIMPGISQAFTRKDDFKANDHGWSKEPGYDEELYDMLVMNNGFATRFGRGNVVLPANLNVIGVK